MDEPGPLSVLLGYYARALPLTRESMAFPRHKSGATNGRTIIQARAVGVNLERENPVTNK